MDENMIAMALWNPHAQKLYLFKATILTVLSITIDSYVLFNNLILNTVYKIINYFLKQVWKKIKEYLWVKKSFRFE